MNTSAPVLSFHTMYLGKSILLSRLSRQRHLVGPEQMFQNPSGCQRDNCDHRPARMGRRQTLATKASALWFLRPLGGRSLSGGLTTGGTPEGASQGRALRGHQRACS